MYTINYKILPLLLAITLLFPYACEVAEQEELITQNGLSSQEVANFKNDISELIQSLRHKGVISATPLENSQLDAHQLQNIAKEIKTDIRTLAEKYEINLDSAPSFNTAYSIPTTTTPAPAPAPPAQKNPHQIAQEKYQKAIDFINKAFAQTEMWKSRMYLQLAWAQLYIWDYYINSPEYLEYDAPINGYTLSIYIDANTQKTEGVGYNSPFIGVCLEDCSTGYQDIAKVDLSKKMMNLKIQAFAMKAIKNNQKAYHLKLSGYNWKGDKINHHSLQLTWNTIFLCTYKVQYRFYGTHGSMNLIASCNL